ncbi:FAD-dependent oxidoreductase [Pseudomonas citronellolis]|uniref:FAD-dependent oxidoreductase n=1 Tax=Pseudomonas citronellolis TaxID=53408 RepID=UPI0023E37796|nr:GMC family oxidoreductase [Pseudomonas citronellolis]MDF3933413.1 GMC family oxidoreductase [Pseudomonas citronellolis]
MIRDYQTQKAHRDAYDFCIVGAGPAGITLALHLAGAGWSVALLEGGGREPEQRSQSLYQCTLSDLDMFPEATRLRYLGGTSNHWSGRCRPFEPSDFSATPPGGLSGWPIAFADIERYLPAAMAIVDLPAGADFKACNAPLVGGEFDADRFLLSPPTRFASKYADALEKTAGLELFLNCNCVDIQFEPGSGRVGAVVVSDYDGQRDSFKATHFILATGAIENARQLLNSQSLAAAGVVREDGFVGRCFMEHLNIDMGTFILKQGQDPEPRQFYTSDAFVKAQHAGKGNVSISLLQSVTAYGRTAEIKDFLENLSCDIGIAHKLDFIVKFNCPGDGTIGTMIEQFPNPQSRVSLVAERDPLGMPKASINWQLSPADRHTIKVIGLEMAKRFADSGLGFVKLHEYVYDATLPLTMTPHAHHMGTTRMAASAESGVVDSDCKVFGTANLYVAGSSIFATGGASNPTMPLLQFALRLAEHLDQQMSRGRAGSS